MLPKYLAFIGRAERAAANPDEGEILPVLPMNVYPISARLIRCWGIAMFCGVVVSFHIPKGFDSVHTIIKDIAPSVSRILIEIVSMQK